MAIRLALLEVSLLILGISGTVLLSNRLVILDWIDVAAYMGQAMAMALSCVTAFYYNDLFDIRKVRGFGEFIARLIQSLGVAFILLALCYTLFPDLQLARGPFFSSLLILGGLVVPVRAAFYALLRSHALSERILILGTGPLAWKIAAEVAASPHLGYTVIGIVDDGGSIPLGASTSTRPSILGSMEKLTALAEELRPDRIVVTLAERRGRLPVNDLLEIRMRGTAVEDGIAIYERLTGKLAIESMMPSYLIFSQDFSKPRWQTALRRAVSLIVAAAGLVIAWPIIGFIAVLIRLDSGGPIFFVQERVGLKGRVFPLLKFRTMHPAGGGTSEWIQDNTHRLTRIGVWLRKFRLDELPQFVNILRGDMNIVGPRPHPVSNHQYFVEKIPYYSIRHTVRPGLTGWAQVQHGYANSLDEEAEKVRYDLHYIKHLSLGLDLRILIDTVKIVLFGRGADAPHTYQPATTMEARHR
jgi:sugar transferase (PEP-CTERM system associated)